METYEGLITASIFLAFACATTFMGVDVGSTTRFSTLNYDSIIVTPINTSLPSAKYKRCLALGCQSEQAGTSGDFPEVFYTWSLKKLKTQVEHYIEKAMTGVVLPVPGFYGHRQRSAIKLAANLAGVENVILVNEGAAVSLSYGWSNFQELEEGGVNVVVLRFGASSFDVTVMSVEDGAYEVMATAGKPLGGYDVDLNIYEWVIEQHSGAVFSTAQRELLLQQCQRAKIDLSQIGARYASIDIDVNGTKTATTLTVEDFMSINQGLWNQIRRTLTQTVDKALLNTDAIDYVLLSGGSTRIPYVQTLVNHVFPRVSSIRHLEEEDVVKGAAILARLRSTAERLPSDMLRRKTDFEQLDETAQLQEDLPVAPVHPSQRYFPPLLGKIRSLADTTSHKYWVKVAAPTQLLNDDNEDNIFVVRRYSLLPSVDRFQVTLDRSNPHQVVSMTLHEDNELIQSFEVPTASSSPIVTVQVLIDESGVVHVTATQTEEVTNTVHDLIVYVKDAVPLPTEDDIVLLLDELEKTQRQTALLQMHVEQEIERIAHQYYLLKNKKIFIEPAIVEEVQRLLTLPTSNQWPTANIHQLRMLAERTSNMLWLFKQQHSSSIDETLWGQLLEYYESLMNGNEVIVGLGVICVTLALTLCYVVYTKKRMLKKSTVASTSTSSTTTATSTTSVGVDKCLQAFSHNKPPNADEYPVWTTPQVGTPSSIAIRGGGVQHKGTVPNFYNRSVSPGITRQRKKKAATTTRPVSPKGKVSNDMNVVQSGGKRVIVNNVVNQEAMKPVDCKNDSLSQLSGEYSINEDHFCRPTSTVKDTVVAHQEEEATNNKQQNRSAGVATLVTPRAVGTPTGAQSVGPPSPSLSPMPATTATTVPLAEALARRRTTLFPPTPSTMKVVHTELCDEDYTSGGETFCVVDIQHVLKCPPPESEELNTGNRDTDEDAAAADDETTKPFKTQPPQ